MGSAPDRVVVGRIVKAHGTEGEVLVEVLSDAPDRFVRGVRLDAGDPDGERRTLTITKTRVDRGKLLVRFAEIRSRDEAGDVRGSLLSITAERVAPPSEGTFYEWQVVGLDAFDEDGKRLGTLVRVDERAGNDLWVIDTGNGETLVPAVAEFVRAVDLEARRVVIRPIPGLFE